MSPGGGLGTFLGGPIGGVHRPRGRRRRRQLHRPAALRRRRAQIEGPRLNDLRVMASTEGAPIPRLWGRMRVAGQVIWATRLRGGDGHRTEKASAKGGGSGGPRSPTYSYFANFAVALCEGEIDRVGRVWADGKEIDVCRASPCGVYTRQRDAGARQPDRRQGGRGQRAGLSRHRLCGVRAHAARALRQPPAATLLRGDPRRRAALERAGPRRQHHPRQHRVRLRHRDRDARRRRRA